MRSCSVDQSGKIEKSNVDTVIAVSNDERVAVLIPSSVKRELEDYARRRGKIKFSFYVKNFCIALSTALRGLVSPSFRIIIDIENPGHEEDVRFMLVEQLKMRGCVISAKQIQFAYVGKHDNAHKLAISVFRRHRKADLKLTLEDFI